MRHPRLHARTNAGFALKVYATLLAEALANADEQSEYSK